MPEVSCSCGTRYEAGAGSAPCPSCGAVQTAGEGLLLATCECGTKFPVPSRLAGKRVKCPKCARHVEVPAAPESPKAVAPFQKPAPEPRVTARPAEAAEGWRAYARWSLVLALLPLPFLAAGGPENVPQRVNRALEAHPEIAVKLQKRAEQKGELSRKDILSSLPEGRLAGAFLPADTVNHWLYALLSAAGFWGFVFLLLPKGNASGKEFWTTALLMGTIGFLLLLVLQYVALLSQGRGFSEGGVLGAAFSIVRFVGFSYGTAPTEAGFALRFLGFLFGVGLIEEFCKTMPLFEYCRRRGMLDLRGAVALGLASGIGFGVSEAVVTSSDLYNGITGGGIYVLRFVPGVALHAAWSATSAILLWRRQAEFRSIGRWTGWLLPLVMILGPGTALHALHETALKMNLEALEWATAAAGFACFFGLYEWARRREPALLAGATA